MSRKGTGTVDWRYNGKLGRECWHARFTRGDAKRTRTPWIALETSIAEHDREGAKAYAASLAPVAKASTKDGVGELVAAYASRWLADRVGRVQSVADDRARMRLHVLPMIGHVSVLSLSRDDVERLRDELDRKIDKGELSWKTVASCWTLATSMCADMVSAKKREFRARDDNPCRDVKPPERGSRKQKQYLTPSEFLKFVTCERVPLRLRRAVAIAVYTFVRDGELRALTWDGGDLDLERGTLSITQALARTGKIKPTKSGETRRFAIEANLLPLLRAMHEEAGKKGAVVSFRDRHMSRDLRLWLNRADVTRPELHKGTSTRTPITWHDLRATGLTWLAVRGDDPLKIKQRAGHTTFSTTELYVREAEAVRDGFGEVFPPLPAEALRIVIDTSVTNPSPLTDGNESEKSGGAGNRTRVRKRLARASTYVAGTLNRSRVAPAGGLSPELVTCLSLASRPVTRRSAIQLGYALRRVLEDPSVGRRSVLFRQRARSRYRSQSYCARVFTWACAPRYAATSSSSPSKPIAPFG